MLSPLLKDCSEQFIGRPNQYLPHQMKIKSRRTGPLHILSFPVRWLINICVNSTDTEIQGNCITLTSLDFEYRQSPMRLLSLQMCLTSLRFYYSVCRQRAFLKDEPIYFRTSFCSGLTLNPRETSFLSVLAVALPDSSWAPLAFCGPSAPVDVFIFCPPDVRM